MRAALRMLRLTAAGVAFLLGLSELSLAETYPAHPVRLIVPFAAAGPTDVIARIVAQKLSDAWGQQV
jgi:tripartite-type tricarboxylate transporter receptor subunit TctC